MNRITSSLAALLVAGSSFVFVGCDEGEGGMAGGKLAPAVGSTVHVQLRRDFLGYALTGNAGAVAGSVSPLIGVMGEGAPQPAAASGILKRMNDDFIVLQVGPAEGNREIWVPRDAVLLMDVTKLAQ